MGVFAMTPNITDLLNTLADKYESVFNLQNR